MTNTQIERLEHVLITVTEKMAETAESAEEVQALAAIASALLEVHKC